MIKTEEIYEEWLYLKLSGHSQGKAAKLLCSLLRKIKPNFKDISVIKHIPHCSIEFPEHFDLLINKDITLQNLKMNDLLIDYFFRKIDGIELKAKYSRLFCDVEKYKDDDKEPMSKYGQGYKYKKLIDGTDFDWGFSQSDKAHWNKEIDRYYDEWHETLNKTVIDEINNGNEVLILDLHSYSDEQAKFIGKEGPFPDVCIGINEGFNRYDILNLFIKKIEEKGYSYKINFPYSGSILPECGKDDKYKDNIISIMLEINKRVYLK